MNPADAARLLAVASTACPTAPRPDPKVAEGWAAILADVELSDALDATTGLIRELGEVTPHLIYNRCAAARRDRASRHVIDEVRDRAERRAQIESGVRSEAKPRVVHDLDDALAVKCRYCHVAPGHRCRNRGVTNARGEDPVVRVPHAKRINDARRAIADGTSERPGQLALPPGPDPTTGQAAEPDPTTEETPR